MSLAKGRVDIMKPQYQSKHLLTAPPVASCTTPLSGLVEMALFSSSAACFSSSGVSDGIHSCPSLSPLLMSLLHPAQCLLTSDSSRSIAFDAGLTCIESKGPSFEQQGQLTAPDAAILSVRHMRIFSSVLFVHTS